jgi:hypothetical protein
METMSARRREFPADWRVLRAEALGFGATIAEFTWGNVTTALTLSAPAS